MEEPRFKPSTFGLRGPACTHYPLPTQRRGAHTRPRGRRGNQLCLHPIPAGEQLPLCAPLAGWGSQDQPPCTGRLKQGKWIFSQFGGYRSKIKVPLVCPGESSLPGLQGATLSVSSHGLSMDAERELGGSSFPYRNASPSDQGPTLTTLFNLSHLPKGPLSKHSCTGV